MYACTHVLHVCEYATVFRLLPFPMQKHWINDESRKHMNESCSCTIQNIDTHESLAHCTMYKHACILRSFFLYRIDCLVAVRNSPKLVKFCLLCGFFYICILLRCVRAYVRKWVEQFLKKLQSSQIIEILTKFQRIL